MSHYPDTRMNCSLPSLSEEDCSLTIARSFHRQDVASEQMLDAALHDVPIPIGLLTRLKASFEKTAVDIADQVDSLGC